MLPFSRHYLLFASVYTFCVAQSINHLFALAETEHVSLSHLQLAQNMREEAKKLEEFREKQKEMRKKVGLISTVVRRSDRGIAATQIKVVTRCELVILDGTTDGYSPQTEVFTVQEDNGRK